MVVNKTITEDFIRYRQEAYGKFPRRGRSDEDFMSDLDLLACEYYIDKDVEEFTLHDATIYDNYDLKHPELGKIEVKTVSSNGYVTLKDYCMSQDWDTLLVWKYLDKPSKILKEGDKITFEIVTLIPRKQVMNILRPSKYEGWYIEVR